MKFLHQKDFALLQSARRTELAGSRLRRNQLLLGGRKLVCRNREDIRRKDGRRL